MTTIVRLKAELLDNQPSVDSQEAHSQFRQVWAKAVAEGRREQSERICDLQEAIVALNCRALVRDSMRDLQSSVVQGHFPWLNERYACLSKKEEADRQPGAGTNIGSFRSKSPAAPYRQG